MIADLRAYPVMKDSGVPWLGEVPEHWSTQPISRMGQLFKGNGGNKTDEVPTGIPCVRYGDLYTRHEFFIRSVKACVTPERARAYTPISYGDVLFAASGETVEDIGRSAVNLIDSEACCGGDILILRPNVDVVPHFLGYAADSPPSRNQKAYMGRGFTVVHVYGPQLKRLVLPLPPLPEQAAIVRFLDHADRRIRRYIRAKQKLIKLLEEQKQAIIHRAVTRGLDPAVRLQPSGVDWLGDVPEQWEVVRAKRLFRPRADLAQPGDVQLSATQAYGVIAQEEFERKIGRKVTRIEKNLDKRRHVEVDDFVISMRSFQGGLERAWEGGCIRSSYVVLKPATPLCVPFFARLFKSRGYIGALQATANFIRDGQDLNYDNFCAVDLPWPPFEEQVQIAAKLDAICDDSARACEQALREVSLLREYRTRLIADVVTGKLDVRQAAARLRDEADEPEPLDETNDLAYADVDTADEAELEEVEA